MNPLFEELLNEKLVNENQLDSIADIESLFCAIQENCPESTFTTMVDEFGKPYPYMLMFRNLASMASISPLPERVFVKRDSSDESLFHLSFYIDNRKYLHDFESIGKWISSGFLRYASEFCRDATRNRLILVSEEDECLLKILALPKSVLNVMDGCNWSYRLL